MLLLSPLKEESWAYIQRKLEFRRIHVFPMFTAATLTTAKAQERYKCPPANERRKKMWYIHTMEHSSAIEKNEITTFVATRMDLEMIILSEVNQTENDKYHRILLLCRLLRKKIQMNLFTKQKQIHRHRKLMGYQRRDTLGVQD